MLALHFLVALLLPVAIAVLFFQRSNGAFCRRPVDIAFAIDASGSVGSWGYYQEKNFVSNTVARFGISHSGTHAAVIVYSTSAHVAISLTQYTSYPKFYYAVRRIPYTRGVTRIDLALKVAAEQVFSEDGGVRSNVPKILVVMTDGYQTHTRNSLSLDKAVLPLKAQGVQVYALAIGQYTKDYELRLIVEKPSHIFRSNKFSRLNTVIEQLAITTCRNALPVAFAIYPLNRQIRGRDISARRAPTGYLSSVASAVGPYGKPGGSFHLQGTLNSYIDFPNTATGKLDTWTSISIFLWVFPEGKPGPIVNYRRSGHGLGLWLSRTRVLEGRVYSRRNYYRRNLYFTHFVPGRWYYVGLMYDNTHGYAILWVNGRVVFRTRMSRIHLATQHPIRMGAVSGVHQYFKGRVTCLQIYGMMLNSNQVATIKRKCAARDQKDPCLASPCQNGGSCIVDSKDKTGYRCRCKPGYHGHRCDVKPTRPTGRPTGLPTTRPTGRPTGRLTSRPTRLTGPTVRSIPTTTSGKSTTPSGTGRVTTPGVITNIDGFRIEVVEYINRFRRLHGAGPLILSTRISMVAQNWAQTLVSRGTASIDPNTSYGTNVFSKVGAQTGLAQTSVITWYTSVKHYDWARRQLKVLALPFIHLIWLSSNFIGVGLSRSPTAKYFVVVYIDPMPGNKPPSVLKDNVLPYTDVFILLQNAIVSCNPGYTNEEGTCYKYHPDKQTWDGALFQSAKENATLISFHKTSEQAFVQKLVPTGIPGLIWTGLNDLITEGTYTWSDGTSVEYTSWKANEPTGSKEDCVGIEVSSYGTMSDAPCTEPHNYISRQPLEGLITYRVKLQLVSLMWTDDYSQMTTLSYMELKEKIETLLLEIYKIDTTFISGYVEEFTKNTKPSSQTTTKPTKPGITTPGSQSTTSFVSAATGRPTGRPTTRPTLFSPGTTKATTSVSKPTSSGTSSVKPTVTVSTILKFGPGVTPDPTKPLQDHLRKNLGRLSAPLNQKSLIESVRIVHPGVPPAVLGTCTSSCLTTCVVSCNPFCCNSKIVAANNVQYTGMRHAVIAQAAPKVMVLPRLFKYPMSPQVNMFPVAPQAPQARPVTVPVTLSVRCLPNPQFPCPPGTQVAQTIQGSYKMPQPGISQRIFPLQPRPVLVQPLVLPGAPVLTPKYLNRMSMNPPIKTTKVTDPPQHIIHLPPPQMQPPCIPSAYNPCPPLMSPPVKYNTTKVTDPPQHIIHLPPPQMQPPCIPSAYTPCPPAMYPPVKTTEITGPPQHIIHLPPPRMQPPCIPSAYSPCPPALNTPTQITKVVDPPQHVIHLPPAPPATPPPSPPSSNFFPMPLSVPVLCIPRPFYPCPPMTGARKLSKPSHKKAKSRAVMPKPFVGPYPVPYGQQPYWQPPVAPYTPFAPPALPVNPLQRPAQYIPKMHGFRTPVQWYRPPLLPPVMRKPLVMSPWVPIPQRPYPRVMRPALNDKPEQKPPRPIPAKGPISLKGSILVYPKPVPAIPPAPPATGPCVPTIYNPCVPFRQYPIGQNPFSMMKPCIPSPANPCLPNTGNIPTKPPARPNESEEKPILLTRPLQVQGSVYFNFRPPPQGSAAHSPTSVPCIPTATTLCPPLMPPRQPFMPPSYVAPKVINPFSNLLTPKVPQPAAGGVAPALVNSNVPNIPPAAPHSIIVQLPEISLQAAPASSLPSPIVPPQTHTPVFPSNCPVSCTHFPGVFCPPYCASYCCKNGGGNRKYTKKKTKEKKKEAKKGGEETRKKTKKQKSILKVKKTKKG